MPNWCSNTLEVSGNAEQLKEFKTKSLVKADKNSPNEFDFTFEGLYPTPQTLMEMTSPAIWRGDEMDIEGKKRFDAEVKELEETYGFDNWYDWRISNWSTKWDCCESTIGADLDDVFIVSYDTAWGPNINWVQKVSEMFPDLKFRLNFMEPGCNFCGVAYCENGEMDVDEGSVEWTDENGNLVDTNDDGMWYRVETNEVIEDQDFYPFETNPFDN
jgi:hypothetical protein